MPLETGTYITDLVVTNPVETDGTGQGADHIRLVKAALKNTFPNFTDVALASTQAELDAAATAVGTDGVTILADAGANFKTNDTDGLRNPAAGEVDIECGGVAGLKVTAAQVEVPGNALVDGSLASTGPITGPGACPIGGSLMWWSDTLPTGFGTWAFLNGGTYLRSNTALWDIFGTSQGDGDGSTTANLPNLCEAVPVGKSTMGGVGSSPGRITQYALTAIGALWGECLHLLTTDETPAHTHSGTTDEDSPDHTHPVGMGTGGGDFGLGSNKLSGGTGSGNTDGASARHTHTYTTSSVGGGDTHNNVQPSVVCNWIIRTA